MKEKEIQDDLASIRSLMERSSKFISLSGLSGILAGIYALIGAAAAFYLMRAPINYDQVTFLHLLNVLPYLIAIAAAVLIASIATCVLLTYQQAKRKGQSIWGKTSRELLVNMAAPLLTGGLLIIIFLYRGYFGIVAPASLIFYGLALLAAGNFTFSDVKFLGICQIILGLIAACLPGYGLLFWALGFGVLHIVYGSVMYLKYDR
ncbi:hypothetical protein [Mucilaginibacter sp.]|uniref:hypothetical protein n=1 Tax=Mucilaginibacter sp. TaxID=1882438 RepID=UPI0026338DB0|nr:hypothetical protein [Mucilaginibacter sp.]MDB5030654.1 hypothetical protein [Mucilaginibacter sp.]